VGALFDFSDRVPEGGLPPNGSTKPKTLRFRLKDMKAPVVDKQNAWKSLHTPLVEVDLQVLGEASTAESGGTKSAAAKADP
jgi:hypothetical protein